MPKSLGLRSLGGSQSQDVLRSTRARATQSQPIRVLRQYVTSGYKFAGAEISSQCSQGKTCLRSVTSIKLASFSPSLVTNSLFKQTLRLTLCSNSAPGSNNVSGTLFNTFADQVFFSKFSPLFSISVHNVTKCRQYSKAPSTSSSLLFIIWW